MTEQVTPEQAYEIGMELAKEILGGKYEFVLTTHIDKEHVHNHLIFNAVEVQIGIYFYLDIQTVDSKTPI